LGDGSKILSIGYALTIFAIKWIIYRMKNEVGNGRKWFLEPLFNLGTIITDASPEYLAFIVSLIMFGIDIL
jgi:hypothetical protein